MNLNKLGIVALSAVTMMSPLTTIISADDKSSNITYTIDSTYEWTIHSNLSLNDGSTTGEVKVNSANIATTDTLVITVKGNGTDNAFTMKDQNGTGSNVISYTVKNGETFVTTGGTVLTLTSSETAPKTTTLTFALASSNVKAGNYKGTVTYTATLNTAGTN